LLTDSTALLTDDRARYAFWRSPADQPRWARPVLLAIAATAAVLYGRNLAHAGYSLPYSAAVRSMSESWKALLYGAQDPGATVTPDKLAGSFVPQAISARIFGFHEWSLALPQAVEGVVSVLVMYRVVRRWTGPAAGALAAGILTFTPVLAAMFGHAMEDGALTMCLVLAADRYQLAVSEGRLRPLLMAGVWVGIGFQAKMLQAWLIVPALALGYLLAAPGPFRRRTAHLAAAGAVTLAVSVSWMLLMTFTPAADRPYIDGSTNNNAFSMVFGYNGFDRMGIHIPGAIRTQVQSIGGGGQGQTGVSNQPFMLSGGPAHGTGKPGPGPAHGTGKPGPGPRPAARPSGGPGLDAGWTKLVGDRLGTQIGWLFPSALLGLAVGLWRSRGRPRTDACRGGLVMWGTWLAVSAAVLSKIDVPHTAYVAILAPPLAALTAVGVVLGVRDLREREWRAWLLPTMVVANAAWAVFLSRDYTGFLPWLVPVVLASAATALAALSVALLRRRAEKQTATPERVAVTARVTVAGTVLGLVAMLAAQATWAALVLDPLYAGSPAEATTGPSLVALGALAHAEAGAADTRRLLGYARAHRDGAGYLFAADTATGTQLINATGADILLMGGFSGLAPNPTLRSVERLVSTGRLRLFLLTDSDAFQMNGGPIRANTVSAVKAWVRSSCVQVLPAAAYSGAGQSTLYRCGGEGR
jgi:4-amino-4-deoxy-L-arabinose transferase-like glycosyltransferase